MKTPTTAYWQIPPLGFTSTPLPEEIDVVIIGSGITGCSIAKGLLEKDDTIRVAVLEARNVCSGATGRNGGHIKAVPEHTYADSIAWLGLERTREVIHFTLANVDSLLDLVPTLSPELQKYCEVRKVESLNLFTDQHAFEEFAGVVEAFEKDNPDLKGRGRIVTAEELRAVSYHTLQSSYVILTAAAEAWRAQCCRWLHILCWRCMAVSSDHGRFHRSVARISKSSVDQCSNSR